MKDLFTIRQNGKTYEIMVPPTAEMPVNYRPGRRWAELTEQALREARLASDASWVFTRALFEDQVFNERVVRVHDREVRWGVAAMHKCHTPQPSPFVELPQPVTSPFLSLELFRQSDGWVLGRLYHGEDYIPPMPWQKSARQARGGMKASRRYWLGERRHALSHQRDAVLDYRSFDELDETPPKWARVTV